MKVSVIIPTYGPPVYLRKTISSVQAQTYTDWELIIVDDNNPNTQARVDTELIVSEYLEKDSKIQYVKHPQNLNGSVARNTGFAIAKGEYISLLDSDDEYLPTRIEKCLNAMDGAPDNVAGVYSCCEFRRGGKTYHISKTAKSGNFLVQTLACTFGLGTGSNIFIKKSVVDELNGFDASFRRHQDYEFMTRLFQRYSLIGLDEVLVVKNNENFNLPDVDKMIEIKKQYLTKFDKIISDLPVDDRNHIYHSHYIQLAEAAMNKRNFRLSLNYYSMAWNKQKLSIREFIRASGLFVNSLINVM